MRLSQHGELYDNSQETWQIQGPGNKSQNEDGHSYPWGLKKANLIIHSPSTNHYPPSHPSPQLLIASPSSPKADTSGTQLKQVGS